MNEPLSAAPLVAVGEASSRGPDRLAIAIVLALVVAFLGQVARFGFVYDDHWTILGNPVVSEGTNALRLLTPTLAREGVPDAGRPTMLLTVMLDAALWGTWPTGFHIQNLIWHGLAASLLLLGLRHVTQSLPMSLFGAAVFAVHPLVAEPVSVVNYREDLLVGAFLLLGIFAVGASRRTPAGWPAASRKLAAAMCFAIAAGAKESAYVAPFLLVLLDRFLPRAVEADLPVRGLPPGRGTKEQWLDALVALVSVTAVFVWRAWAVGKAGTVSVNAEEPGLFVFYRIVESVHGFIAGCFHVVYPFGLSPEYDPVVWDTFGLAVGIASLVVFVLLLGATVWLRRRSPLVALGLAWAVVAYIPTLGIVAITNERADRYLYVSLMGLALAFVVALTRGAMWASAKFRRSQPATVLGMPLAWLLAALLVLGSGLQVRAQSLVWANDEQLWMLAVQRAPNSPRAWAGWAAMLLQKRQTLEAQMAAATGLQRFNGDPRLREILGLTYMSQGSIETACHVLGQAGDDGTAFDRAQRASNLGYCLMRLGKFDEALEHFAKARGLAPWFDRGWTNAIETLKRMGRAEEAKALDLQLKGR